MNRMKENEETRELIKKVLYEIGAIESKYVEHKDSLISQEHETYKYDYKDLVKKVSKILKEKYNEELDADLLKNVLNDCL